MLMKNLPFRDWIDLPLIALARKLDRASEA
jgi:hypothetical protein